MTGVRRRWINTWAGLAMLAVAVGGVSAGYLARPYPVREGVRLVGAWSAVAYTGTCRTDADRVQALTLYEEGRRLVRRAFAFPPTALAREAACAVTAVRAGRNLIVDAGEEFLVDAWQNLVELEIMRYHGIGTSTTAATELQTGCLTELTTEYNPDNTRATGSLTEGASPSIFRSVGTNTVDASAAVTEWCLMSQAATGGGTMWSRVVFSVINLSSGDSLQTTYDLTVE